MAQVTITSTKTAALYTGAGNDVNDGGDVKLRVYADGTTTFRPLIAFDLSSIPTNAIISDATITLKAEGEQSGSLTLAAYKVLRDWGEGNKSGTAADVGESTWNSAKHTIDAWGTPGCDNTTTDRSATPEDTKSVSVDGNWVMKPSIATVQDWVSHPTTNYGLIIRSNEPAGQNYIYFFSDDSAGNEPTIIVTYTVPVVGGSTMDLLGV